MLPSIANSSCPLWMANGSTWTPPAATSNPSASTSARATPTHRRNTGRAAKPAATRVRRSAGARPASRSWTPGPRLQRRLGRIRWPDELPGVSWDLGVPVDTEHWRSSYDWRQWEATLSGYPHYTAKIDGQTIRFSRPVTATGIAAEDFAIRCYAEHANTIPRWSEFDRGGAATSPASTPPICSSTTSGRSSKQSADPPCAEGPPPDLTHSQQEDPLCGCS